MRSSAVAGLIFANSNDSNISDLTKLRSMASLPFGGRYRLIDFALSNMTNAGISNVGVITNENYRSLMDHVGSGLYWDLDRKQGGLIILPPYNVSGLKSYSGYSETLMRAIDFVKRLNCEYVVVYESGAVANIDVRALVNSHIANDADITVVYRNSENQDKLSNTVSLEFGASGKVFSANKANDFSDNGNYSLGISVFKKETFVNLSNFEGEIEEGYIYKNAISENVGKLKIYGYCQNGFCAAIDSKASYFNANMMLLKGETRKDLFNKQNPIYTKTRDDMPTRYGINSVVQNSFIADGCVVDGTVKNSILFRGVKVRKGAVVENCIVMQGTEIKENAKLCFAISDKNVTVSENGKVLGNSEDVAFIPKGKTV